VLLCFAVAVSAAAQDADELAKQTQNPVASLISVPFQSNFDFGLGERDATGALLNFQPVMPFGLSKSTNVILRVILPLTSQPGPDLAVNPLIFPPQPRPTPTRINGLGDTVTTVFFSPAKSGRLIWGLGPVLLLPTATNTALGSEKFGVGPSLVALTQPGKWTVGVLANQIWSVSGASDRDDVNTTYLQPFANYNLGNGLSTGVSLEASANWEADDTWTAPLLFSLSKVTILGKRPVNFAIAAGPTLASSEAAAEWRFRLAATFLFPR
jgi:hypothetical protein